MDTAQKVIGSAAVKQKNTVTTPLWIAAGVVVGLVALLLYFKNKP